MTPEGYMIAARVPRTIQPQEFGLWTITRLAAGEAMNLADGAMLRQMVGFDDYTLLHRHTEECMHLPYGEIVMEDSKRELRKHLPIWMAARGRVLVTGLGLGCVVRGLLANPAVTRIDVVEIDEGILRVIGPEFEADDRVQLRHGDALSIRWAFETKFDFAWHDLWMEGDGLQRLHAKLFLKYRNMARVQGAWAFPRELWRLYACRLPLIGGPKFRGVKVA